MAFILLDLFSDILVKEQLTQDEGAHGLNVQTLRLGQDLLVGPVDGSVLLPLLQVRELLFSSVYSASLKCSRFSQTGSAPQMLKAFSHEHNGQSEAAHFDKVVEQIDPLLQGLLQVIAQRQVLGVVADFLHAPPLRLLRGLLCPVLIFVISILHPRQERVKVI